MTVLIKKNCFLPLKAPLGVLIDGRVAERFKALVLKTSVGESPPWVRIPPLPPTHRVAKQTASPDDGQWAWPLKNR